MALCFLERALGLGLLASMMARRGFIKFVTLLLEAPERAMRATLVARTVMATAHVTRPSLFGGIAMPLWKEVFHHMVCDIFGKTPRLLYELHLGLLVEMWAIGMRTCLFHARHHSMEFFTASLLLCPGASLVAILVAGMIVATLSMARHGFPDRVQLLHRRGHCHRTLEMACEIMLTDVVTRLDICPRRIEEIALRRDPLKWALVLRASCKAALVLVAPRTALFDVLPGGLLGQVLVE